MRVPSGPKRRIFSKDVRVMAELLFVNALPGIRPSPVEKPTNVAEVSTKAVRAICGAHFSEVAKNSLPIRFQAGLPMNKMTLGRSIASRRCRQIDRGRGSPVQKDGDAV